MTYSIGRFFKEGWVNHISYMRLIKHLTVMSNYRGKIKFFFGIWKGNVIKSNVDRN